MTKESYERGVMLAMEAVSRWRSEHRDRHPVIGWPSEIGLIAVLADALDNEGKLCGVPGSPATMVLDLKLNADARDLARYVATVAPMVSWMMFLFAWRKTYDPQHN